MRKKDRLRVYSMLDEKPDVEARYRDSKPDEFDSEMNSSDYATGVCIALFAFLLGILVGITLR